MMIVLSTGDFRKLSPVCQQEVLALLTGNGVESPLGDDETSLPFETNDNFAGLGNHAVFHGSEIDNDWPSNEQPLAAAEVGTKRVVDISQEQARELLANVSDKSQGALRLFAAGQPVSLNVLIGPNAPYRDLNDLKRSLVGAVNRRLRTVTENRSAVLFSSDREKTRIRITPTSAVALRHALNIAEGLPIFEYFDPAGNAIREKSEIVVAFEKQLETAWAGIGLRPLTGRFALTQSQTVNYLLGKGFTLATGTPTPGNPEASPPSYEFKSIDHEHASTQRIEDIDSNWDGRDDDRDTACRYVLQHPAVPLIYAALR